MDNTQPVENLLDAPTCIPPFVLTRNEYGLICNSNLDYVYNEDGTINWRKMVKTEFLVPHKQVFERTGKPVPQSIEGLSDKELLILLGGIKELAATRGFSAIRYKLVSPSPEYVAAVCEIDWIPNYETQGRAVTTSGIGDASPLNTTSFGRIYLAPFAENRAFVRCVRQFLRINVVSQEEIGEMAVEAAEDTVTTLLKQAVEKYNIPFETIKDRMIKEKVDGAEKFTTLGDIPRFKQFELIERIKERAAKRENEASS